MVYFFWLFLLVLHSPIYARAPDTLLHNCSNSLKVALGHFNPDGVENTRDVQTHTLEWQDFAQPLTFYARIDKKRHFGDLAAVLHLEDHLTGQNLTNCYLFGHCSDELICCYRFRTPEKFQKRYLKHCLPSESCQALNQPCQANCFSEMVINVAFGRNRVEGGGAVHVSVDYNLHKLTQGGMPFAGEEFDLIPEQEVKRRRKKLVSALSASPINSETVSGFWVRYIKERTLLEVGMDGEEDPAVSLELWDKALLLEEDLIVNGTKSKEADRDTWGWYGDEVIGLEKVFSPTRYVFDIPRGGTPLEIGANCSSVLYSKFGQVQTVEGGTCLRHTQCPTGYKCVVDHEDIPDGLTWFRIKRCTPIASSFLDKNWLAVLIMVAIAGFMVTMAVSLFLYRGDNNLQRKRNYLIPVEESKTFKKFDYEARHQAPVHNYEWAVVDDDAESVIEIKEARKSKELKELQKMHEMAAGVDEI